MGSVGRDEGRGREGGRWVGMKAGNGVCVGVSGFFCLEGDRRV